MADLVAAGGTLRVSAWPSEGERDYRALVASAQRHGKVPVGKRITTTQNRDGLEIRLADAIEGTLVELQPVPVPARLTRPHPVARQFRDRTDHHEVSRAALSRCTRIVHALAVEAERRAMKIENVTATKNEYGHTKWSGGNDGHLAITVREQRYAPRIAEEKVRARGRWEREATWTEWSATGGMRTRRKPGRYDDNATGRVTISLLSYSREGRAVSWADRQAWTLEDKLPELLRELEVRAAEDDYARAEAKRAAHERQRQWEIEMERAKERFAEAHRGKVLRAQIAARQEAEVARTLTLPDVRMPNVERIWPVVVNSEGLLQTPSLWEYLRGAGVLAALGQPHVQPLTLLDLEDMERLMGLAIESHRLIEILAGKTRSEWAEREFSSWFGAEGRAYGSGESAFIDEASSSSFQQLVEVLRGDQTVEEYEARVQALRARASY